MVSWTAVVAELSRRSLSTPCRVVLRRGDAICYVMWQKFANHVQKIADSMGTGKPGDY